MSEEAQKQPKHPHWEIIERVCQEFATRPQATTAEKAAARYVQVVMPSRFPENDRDKTVAEIKAMAEALQALIGPIIRHTRR